jgi:hypothetical protein
LLQLQKIYLLLKGDRKANGENHVIKSRFGRGEALQRAVILFFDFNKYMRGGKPGLYFYGRARDG